MDKRLGSAGQIRSGSVGSVGSVGPVGSAGSNPGQASTGSCGYRAKRGSVLARAHRR